MYSSPFVYQQGDLFCEGVPLSRIAREFGTPCYVYSYTRIVENYRCFEDAFGVRPHLIAYAVKANSNGAILRILAHEGSGADVVSGGELARARAAGIIPQKIVFAGVGKRGDEIEQALREGILLLNVESLAEMKEIGRVAEKLSLRVRVAVRVNPQVIVHTHPYITTGSTGDKFGLPVNDALDAYRIARDDRSLDPVGVHMHIGSQITDLSSYRRALEIVHDLVHTLSDEGTDISYIDLGGGLGISYSGDPVPGPGELAAIVLSLLKGFDGKIILEPGRSIVGDAGVLLTTVLYAKPSSPRSFVIVDAGMNDFIRPALYGAQHRVLPVVGKEGPEKIVDVVGPVCESADILAHHCVLPNIEPGEYLAVRDAGAYGFSMSSRYNSRPRPAEVLVRGEEVFLIRERETREDLTFREQIPRFLS